MNVLFNLSGKNVLPGIGNSVENSLMDLAFQVHVMYVKSECIKGLIPQSLELQTKVTLVNLISKVGRVPKLLWRRSECFCIQNGRGSRSSCDHVTKVGGP